MAKILKNADFINSVIRKEVNKKNASICPERTGNIKGRFKVSYFRVELLLNEKRHAVMTVDTFDKASAILDEWRHGEDFPTGIHFYYR